MTWRSHLSAIREEIENTSEEAAAAALEPKSAITFLINIAASLSSDGLVVDLFSPRPETETDLFKFKPTNLGPDELGSFLLGEDPQPAGSRSAVVTALPVIRSNRGRRGTPKVNTHRVQRFRLPQELYESVLKRLTEQNTLGWWDGRVRGDRQLLRWDDGAPWKLVLDISAKNNGDSKLTGSLRREADVEPLSAPVLILPTGAYSKSMTADAEAAPPLGVVVFRDRIGRLEVVSERDDPWLRLLRSTTEILVPKEDLQRALTGLLEMPQLPELALPKELQLSAEDPIPRPRLVLEPLESVLPNPPLIAELSFVYGELEASAGDPRRAVVDWQRGRYVRRDTKREHRALVRLLEAGVRPVPSAVGHDLELSPQELPVVAEPLLDDGWTIEVHGNSLRPASPPAMRVESGIDWFEVRGSLDFDGDPIELDEILKAISTGNRLIKLADGSSGLLPASWMETYDSLAKLAQSSSEDGLRFLPSQALLVDALLTTMPRFNVDAAFGKLRAKLASFDRIKPKKELPTFAGTLRGYQRHGLGWLSFLREFGLGGVLADDMGLGKTVQVLALIQAFRTPSKTSKRPWLVVAPRSLVYNWIDEAKRFTPKLKAVEYAGSERESLHDQLDEFDLVVTTYGTMRLDIPFLATVEFDTVILDEAQAIKNPTSQTAKASNLLMARNRLALTGTPIENHLGELGSIFEFLNPGLLGRLPKLDVLASGRAASGKELERVAQGIRPFILRRTKAEVLPDLPPKTEQVLFCSLRPKQRELYDKVKAGYQASLLRQIETKGVGGSAIQVLEALLRLRQIACHPGLVEESWGEAGSAKLEVLYEQVFEVLDEGHKIIVFSQFTSLLAYVRRHLDNSKVNYAYLDGQTRDRAAVVEQFQTDPNCNLFLVSLKAGGFGLNLTAADYVFLLDPWWNPAVEAQAIDRAHRIGQTQPVFAYRMIARDTVEEKILELQKSKRKIADAVLDGDGTTLRDLTADDLRVLLS